MTTRESAAMFVEAASREAASTGQTVRQVLTTWHVEASAARERRYLDAYALALATVSPQATFQATAPTAAPAVVARSAADRAYDLALAESQAANRAWRQSK